MLSIFSLWSRSRSVGYLLIAGVLLLALAGCGATGPEAGPVTSPTGVARAAPPGPSPTPTSEVSQPTVTPVPTATVRPSPTPVAMLPTQTPRPTATTAPAPQPPTPEPSVLNDEVYTLLQTLTEQYSPRESATDQELEAAHYLQGQLEDLGYVTSLSDFSAEQVIAEVVVETGQGSEPVTHQSLPITLSAEGSGTGLLVSAGRAYAEDIPSEGLEGKVALIERGGITFEEKVNRVAEAGAVGAIVFNNQRGLFFGRFTNSSEIPAVAVSQADGTSLSSLVEGRDVTAVVTVENRVSLSRNVIADKHGVGDSDKTLILGAHYDTVPDTQGASDNGSGASVVMTIARHIADRDYPFDIRIIYFGAEEIGLFGSRHYVEQMSVAEVANTLAMLNFDALGSGSGLVTIGSMDVVREVQEIGADLGRISIQEGRSQGASDHAPFERAGIPVMFLTSNDLSRINSPLDEIIHINPDLLGWAAEIGIAMVDRLAEDATN